MYKSGGETEKGGNQYESDVLTYYFARLLNDEVRYIQSESFKTELAQGTDFLILDNNGKTYAVQVKSRAGLDDCWSVGKLNSYSIIENACKHIWDGRDFHLVSPLSFTALQDWCRQSHEFNDFKEFEMYIIGTNRTSAQSFETLLERIRHYTGDDSPILFFHHFNIDVIPDDKQNVIDKLASSGHITEPEKAYSVLDHYCTKEQRLCQKIYVSEIRNYLLKNNITFFNIDKQSASQTLNDLQEKFINNLERRLIHSEWIERDEYKKLEEILDKQNVAIISGQAGTGKTGLIYRLCKKLKEQNCIFLPLSIEVNMPFNNLYEYGKSLGFTASPIEVLKTLSNGENCYLIFDQVDAIKWQQTDWNSAFDACCSIVKECSRINYFKIVFACRSIDADNILKFWDNSPPKLSDCQLCMSQLSNAEISSIISPEKFKLLSSSAVDMLRNINNLKLFTELCATKSYIPTKDIIHDFINSKQKEVCGKGFTTSEIKNFHNYLIGQLRKNNTTTLPKNQIEDSFSDELINAYCSAGVIEITSTNKIKFTHQSILDYYLVKDLVNELDDGKKIISILKRYNSQPLSMLEIIKQFLESCYESEYYIDYLDQILFCKSLRMIIKNVAIHALRTLNSGDRTNQLYMKVLRSPYYGLKYLYFLCNGNQSFSQYFIEQSELDYLLTSPDNNDNCRAIDILLQAGNKQAIQKLTDFTKVTANEAALRVIINGIDDITSPDELFDLKISLLKSGIYKRYYVEWAKLSNNVKRLADYITLFLTTDCIDYEPSDETEQNLKIDEAVRTDPSYFCNLAMTKIKNEFSYELDCDIISLFDSDKKFCANIFETSLAYIKESELINLIDSKKKLFQHSALRGLLKCNHSKGLMIFIKLVDSKFVSKQNYFYDRQLLEIVCNLLKEFSDDLPQSKFRDLENQIISYKSPSLIEYAKDRFSQHKSGEYYPFYEEEQKRFLEVLPHVKLSDYSINYLKFLNRKFPSKSYFTWTPEMDQVMSYTVISCIADKWEKFSEKTWHKIMSNPKAGKSSKTKICIKKSGQALGATLNDFCNTITTATRVNPKLFTDIALKYDDIERPFINAICEGFNLQEYNTCLNEELKAHKKYFDITDERYLFSFLRFIKHNKVMDSWIYNKLLEIANLPEEYEKDYSSVRSSRRNGDSSDLTTHDLESLKINKIQTLAIEILASTLADKNELPDEIRSIIMKCLSASQPVLMLSAIDILYAIWNFDNEFAFNNLFILYQKDIRLLPSSISLKFLKVIISTYHEQLIPLLNFSIRENKIEHKNLYRFIIETYCYYGYYKDLVESLIILSDQLVVNVCTQIIKLYEDTSTLDRARKLILSVKDDGQEKKDIRKHYISVIEARIMSNPKNFAIVLKTIKSNNFFSDYYYGFRFIYELQKITKLVPIRKLIFCYCKEYFKAINLKNILNDNLINLIIRLYFEAKDAKKLLTAKKCLRILDKMLLTHVSNELIIK